MTPTKILNQEDCTCTNCFKELSKGEWVIVEGNSVFCDSYCLDSFLLDNDFDQQGDQDR